MMIYIEGTEGQECQFEGFPQIVQEDFMAMTIMRYKQEKKSYMHDLVGNS